MRPVRTCRASQRGFSFVEMLATCCIASVLAAAAAPSLHQVLAENQSRADVTEFTEAIRLARSEALKRSLEVTLCAGTPTLAEGTPVCRTDSNDWSAGWIVFLDGGERGRLESGDLLIRMYQRPAAAGRVLAGLRSITFQANGVSVRGNTTVRFMAPGAAEQGVAPTALQVVCVNKPGRAKVVPGPDCAG